MPLPSGTLHATVLDPDQTKVWVEHFSKPKRGNSQRATTTSS